MNINSNKKQSGTTLVEVLVAAFIIGFALLGISALQMKAMQYSTNSEFRAKAADIAWALADRMRANLTAGDIATGSGNEYIENIIVACPANWAGAVCAMEPGAANTAGVTQCTAAQMAAYDMFQLTCDDNLGAAQVLPGGTLAVSCIDKDAAGPDLCDPESELRITITWVTRNEVVATNNTVESFTMRVTPGEDPLP
jgi:type IV pilus modification protein PilV